MKLRLTPLSGRQAFVWAVAWFAGAALFTFALWKPFFHVVPFLAFFAALAITAARNGPWWGIGSAVAALATLFTAGMLPMEEFFIRSLALLANASLIIWLGSLLRRGASESQAYQESIADAVSDFVWSCDSQRRPLYANERTLEFFGATMDEISSRGWKPYVHSDDTARLARVFAEGNLTGEFFDYEVRYRRHDGVYLWFMSRAVPIKNAQGKIVKWIGTSTNVDVRKCAEMEREELLARERAAREDAERASRMKDEFLATLSHELRTPLNAIVGWVHLLKNGASDAKEVQEGLEVIERNSHLQTQLIDDLLDMSRIISGKVRLDVQSVDLPLIIDAAIETVQPSIDAKQIRLTRIVDPFAGEIRGDPARLQQIVWNLLNNAIKFTPKGGRVDIALERDHSQVKIVVSDSGEGIAPAFLPHVFDRFRQADATTTRRHGGLGIGLAIVKQLVELHGGTVEAGSKGEGCGATFQVTLPLPVAPASQGPARQIASVSGKDSGGDESSKLEHVKVLVVDDEPDSRDILKRILHGFGAEVTTAASAQDALSELRGSRYHTMISDIGMPEMDGFELMRKVRAADPKFGNDIPAVALTAFARSEDRLRAMQAGFDMFLSKPVDPAELLAIVKRCATRVDRDASLVSEAAVRTR